MAILIDTHVLAWIGTDDPRLSIGAKVALSNVSEKLLVSAATAFEFSELNQRGRFGVELPLALLLRQLSADVVDFPAACWRLADDLPRIHRDPVDRMVIAHAIQIDAQLATADEAIRRYPVRLLW